MLVILFIHKSASGLGYLQFFENVKIGEKFCPKLILTYFFLSLSEIITFTFLLVSFIIFFFFFIFVSHLRWLEREIFIVGYLHLKKTITKMENTHLKKNLNQLKNTCHCLVVVAVGDLAVVVVPKEVMRLGEQP